MLLRLIKRIRAVSATTRLEHAQVTWYSLGLQPVERHLGTNGAIALVRRALVGEHRCRNDQISTIDQDPASHSTRSSRVLVNARVLLAPVTSQRYAKL